MNNENLLELDRPYKAEPSGILGYVIRDPNGKIFAWVLGEANARRMAGAMNLAYDCGLLD